VACADDFSDGRQSPGTVMSAAPLAGDVKHSTGRCGGPLWWGVMWRAQTAASMAGGGARQHHRLLEGVLLDN
jgi:hypothetical protein